MYIFVFAEYRDLGEDINTYFHAFLSTMCSIVDKVAVSGGVIDNDEAPNPELTGKLFETMAHLLRYGSIDSYMCSFHS